MVDIAARMADALAELMEWQVKNVKRWNNPAYDNASRELAAYRSQPAQPAGVEAVSVELPEPAGTMPAYRVVGPGGEGGNLLNFRGGDLIPSGSKPSGQYTADQLRAYGDARAAAARVAALNEAAAEATHWQTISTTPGHACGQYIAAVILGLPAERQNLATMAAEADEWSCPSTGRTCTPADCGKECIRTTVAAEAEAMHEAMVKVRAAITGYYTALDNRLHGGVAAAVALGAIEAALNMSWNEHQARAAMAARNPGADANT